jgi:transcriptional regulator with XRE-family HTH domain
MYSRPARVGESLRRSFKSIRGKMKQTSLAEAAQEDVAEVSIGGKLRHLRRLNRLTLRDVAAAVDCSESMLSKIETDRASPSLQLLHRLAEALGTTVQALFSDTEQPTLTVYRDGQRPLLKFRARSSDGSSVQFERMIPHAEGRTLNANVHVVPPGCGSDGILRHRGEEVGYVLEGQIELIVDGVGVLVSQGGSFFFNSALPHSYRNVGATTARIIWVNTPPY